MYNFKSNLRLCKILIDGNCAIYFYVKITLSKSVFAFYTKKAKPILIFCLRWDALKGYFLSRHSLMVLFYLEKKCNRHTVRRTREDLAEIKSFVEDPCEDWLSLEKSEWLEWLSLISSFMVITFFFCFLITQSLYVSYFLSLRNKRIITHKVKSQVTKIWQLL